MLRVSNAMLLLIFSLLTAASSAAQENQPSLMGMIAEWQYPKSTFNGAEMADGATINSDGKRTVQSIVCKTVMTTDDSVEKVVEYYKAKLQHKEKQNGDMNKPKKQSGRSVVFHDDSTGRPFAMHVISINTNRSSTTLIITRGEKELKTHIAWKYYSQL